MGPDEEITRLRRQNRQLKNVLLGFVAVTVLLVGSVIVSALHAKAQQARALDLARRAQMEAHKAQVAAQGAQQKAQEEAGDE